MQVQSAGLEQITPQGPVSVPVAGRERADIRSVAGIAARDSEVIDPRRSPSLGPNAQRGLVAAQSDAGADGLTEAERELVRALSARDREVRDHEEAHARVGGQYAGQPSYDYQQGPDGQRYAVGGSVAIDVSAVPDDPAATIAKMEIVKAAALAPAEPSAQDRQVAAQADATRLQAMAELALMRSEERADLNRGEKGPLAQFRAALEALRNGVLERGETLNLAA